MECPRCGAEAHWEVVDDVEGKGYVWEARCNECIQDMSSKTKKGR